MTHNELQRACTNLSSDTELVIGEIYGLRQWRIKPWHEDYVLVGHRGKPWNLGETNVAVCHAGSRPVCTALVLQEAHQHVELAVRQTATELFQTEPDLREIAITNNRWDSVLYARRSSQDPQQAEFEKEFPPSVPEQDTLDLSTIGGDSITPIYRLTTFNDLPIEYYYFSGSVPRDPHRVTDPSCTCGFYAYTDAAALEKNSYDDPDVVFGLIKAYGLVTQGTLGFRAEKAEVVALTQPLEFGDPNFVGDQFEQSIYPFRTGRFAQHFTTGEPAVETWIPSTNPKSRKILASLVPKGVQIYEDLNTLLAEAKPFLQTKEGESDK